MIEHSHQPVLVVLSIAIAIFASYVALDLAGSIWDARGWARTAWLAGGSLAMGVGIWSMHFVGMLALRADGLRIAYSIFEIIASVLVAIIASAIALFVVSRRRVTALAYTVGSVSMGAAIAGMHYIGMASMRMAAIIEWNVPLVVASVGIAVFAALAALALAFQLRGARSLRGFLRRLVAGVVMGFAISGMHYTAMAAVMLRPGPSVAFEASQVLATSGLAVAVICATLVILAVALSGSIVERALSRREAVAAQISRILESISDAFYSVDRQWRFTYVNRVALDAMTRSLGYEPGPLLGQSLWDALPFVRGTRFEKEYRRAMRDRVPIHVEARVESRKEWVEAHAYPAPDGLSVYFHNINDRKQYEDELHAAIRARDEFLSVVSHELKTPLTALKLQFDNRLRLLDKGDPAPFSPEKMRGGFERDRRLIARINRLIDDMLDIGRLSTGKLTLRREPVDLCALVLEVLEAHQDQIAQVGGQVAVKRRDRAVGQWDRFRIEQVLVNLLTNALRYGGRAPIDIEVRRSPNCAYLIVCDRGPGIAAVDQERIFERFERASSEQSVGLGLGLYITRQIVEMHGGSIRVESKPAEGATFTVALPIDEESVGRDCE